MWLKFHDFGLNSEHSEIENHNINYLHLQLVMVVHDYERHVWTILQSKDHFFLDQQNMESSFQKLLLVNSNMKNFQET